MPDIYITASSTISSDLVPGLKLTYQLLARHRKILMRSRVLAQNHRLGYLPAP